MATGSGSGRDSDYSRGSSRYDDRNSYTHQPDPRESARMTQELVGEFKRALQERIDSGLTIDKQAVEFTTFNAKNTLDAERNSIVRLKRSLPDDLRSMPHDLLIAGMAYNNDPDKIVAFCRSEMRQSLGNASTNAVFLDGIVEPLKKLKNDLNRSSEPHPSTSVRQFDKRQLARATRLLYSEAYHMLPSLNDFTFDDAEDIAEAFQESSYEMREKQELLPFFKTCRVGQAKEMMQGMQGQLNSTPGRATTTDSSRGDRSADRDSRYADERSGATGSPSGAHRRDGSASSNSRTAGYRDNTNLTRFN